MNFRIFKRFLPLVENLWDAVISSSKTFFVFSNKKANRNVYKSRTFVKQQIVLIETNDRVVHFLGLSQTKNREL